MRTVFSDASYWIAIVNPLETLHLKAQAVSRTLGNSKILTTDLVLAETLNFYAGRGPRHRQLAAQYMGRVMNNPRVEVVHQSRETFQKALTLYGTRLDKEWGMIDCVSFTVMQERGIADALAYDHHFQQAGFRALLRDI